MNRLTALLALGFLAGCDGSVSIWDFSSYGGIATNPVVSVENTNFGYAFNMFESTQMEMSPLMQEVTVFDEGFSVEFRGFPRDGSRPGFASVHAQLESVFNHIQIDDGSLTIVVPGCRQAWGATGAEGSTQHFFKFIATTNAFVIVRTTTPDALPWTSVSCL